MKLRTPTFFAIFGVLATSVIADDAPRWKLSTGDVLNYEVVKRVELTVANSPENFRLEQRLQTQWDVEGVADDGSASVNLAIKQADVQMKDPLGELKYDSTKDDPSGVIALAGPIYDELLEKLFRFRIAPNGKVDDFQVPDDLIEAIESSSLSEQLADFGSREALEKFLLPLFFVFDRDQYSTGDKWSVESTSENGQLGKQQVETTLEYLGSKLQDETNIGRFKLNRTLTLPAEQQAKITSQESTGELLFDLSTGRLTSAELEIDVRMEFSAEGQTVPGRLQQTTSVRLVEKEAE